MLTADQNNPFSCDKDSGHSNLFVRSDESDDDMVDEATANRTTPAESAATSLRGGWSTCQKQETAIGQSDDISTSLSGAKADAAFAGKLDQPSQREVDGVDSLFIDSSENVVPQLTSDLDACRRTKGGEVHATGESQVDKLPRNISASRTVLDKHCQASQVVRESPPSRVDPLQSRPPPHRLCHRVHAQSARLAHGSDCRRV